MSSRIIALPTVLLQSIMRCCDVRDLLALSQLCRTAVQAASSPFPWSLVTARLCSLQPDFVGLLCRSLLRFAPAVDLLWLSPNEYTQPTDSSLEQVCSLPWLRSLTAFDLKGADWNAILRRPCFAQLQSLHITACAGDGSLTDDALFALPHLHTVRYRGSPISLRHALPCMAALTDLNLEFDANLACDLRSIAECAGLVRLEIGPCELDSLSSILSHKQQALRSLTLWKPTLRANSQELTTAFNASPALEHLTILCCEESALLLRALSQSLSPDGPLRVLTIVHFCGAHPLGSDLTSLLSRLPLLVRLEWELVELATSPKFMFAHRVRGARLRVRGRRFSPNALRTLYEYWIERKAAGQALAQLDPRIELVEPTPSLSPQEQARALRERFQPSTDS